MSRRLLLLVVLTLTPLLGGCEINGNDSLYPGASVWQAQDKGFHFHYMQPPWRQVPPRKGQLVRMLVDGFIIYEVNSDSISYHLEVSYSAAKTPELAAKAVKAMLLKDKHTIVTDLATVRSLAGDEGIELYTSKHAWSASFNYRNAFYTDANGKVVRLSLIGLYPLDEQDAQDLIHSYSASEDDGTEVPVRKPDRGVAKDGGVAKDAKVGG